MQVTQQHVQPIEGPGPLGDQVITPVGEQPQDDGVVLGAHLVQALVALRDRDRGHGRGVGDVGLAGAARAEEPGSGRELGRYVQDRRLGGGEQLGDAAAQSASALHRPLPFGPGLRPLHQLGADGLGDRQAELAERNAGGAERDRRERALMRVDTDRDQCGPFPRSDGIPRGAA